MTKGQKDELIANLIAFLWAAFIVGSIVYEAYHPHS
jgi:hypothetical protein